MSILTRTRRRGRLHVTFSAAPTEVFIVHKVAKSGDRVWRVTHRETSFATGKPLRTQGHALATADKVMASIGTEKVLECIAAAEAKKTHRLATVREGVRRSFRKVAQDLRTFHPKTAV